MNEVKEMSAVTLNETNGGKVLELQLTGKVTKEDYEQFVEMRDFHGWTAGALWQDVKFDAKHFSDIERLTIVGETKWQHGMATRSAVSPNNRPHSSEWSPCPITIKS